MKLNLSQIKARVFQKNQKWIETNSQHEMQPENLWYAFGLRHFNEFHIYCILAKSKNCTLLRVLLILNAT